MQDIAKWVRLIPVVLIACATMQSAAAQSGKSGSLATPGASSGAPSGKAFRMKQVQVMDRSNGPQPVPAVDVLIPTDWKFEGSVRYENRGCFADIGAIVFRATSPDGRLAFEGFPSTTWQYSQNPAVQKYLAMENQQGAKTGLKPCPVNPPVAAADALRNLVLPKTRPGKQIVSIEPMADLNQAMSNRISSLQQPGSSGQQVQFRADAARARLKYDLEGQTVEEWVTAVTVARAATIATGSGPAQGVDCRLVMVYAMRAPAGQLEANETLFRMIRSSVHAEPNWLRGYLANVSQLTQVQMAQRKARGDLIRQFQQYEIAVIQGVTANSVQGANQAFIGADRITRGVEPYRDPETGRTYELSYLYGNAWINKNNNNEIVLSDDPNLQPGKYFDGQWSSLEHVQAQP